MTAARIVGGPEVVLAAHGHVGWLTVPAECPTCDGLGETGVDAECSCGEPNCSDIVRYVIDACPSCGGSGRNPIIDLAGHTIELWTKLDVTDIDLGEWRYRAGALGDRFTSRAVMWREIPESPYVTDQMSVPLGVCVGTARIAQVLPIVGPGEQRPSTELRTVADHVAITDSKDLILIENGIASVLSDQLPFSLWEPGRWAIHLTEPKART